MLILIYIYCSVFRTHLSKCLAGNYYICLEKYISRIYSFYLESSSPNDCNTKNKENKHKKIGTYFFLLLRTELWAHGYKYMDGGKRVQYFERLPPYDHIFRLRACRITYQHFSLSPGRFVISALRGKGGGGKDPSLRGRRTDQPTWGASSP